MPNEIPSRRIQFSRVVPLKVAGKTVLARAVWAVRVITRKSWDPGAIELTVDMAPDGPKMNIKGLPDCDVETLHHVIAVLEIGDPQPEGPTSYMDVDALEAELPEPQESPHAALMRMESRGLPKAALMATSGRLLN